MSKRHPTITSMLDRSPGIVTTYVEELEARVRELEQALKIVAASDVHQCLVDMASELVKKG